MTQVCMVSGSGAGGWWEIIDSAVYKGPEVRGQYSTRKSSAGLKVRAILGNEVTLT